MPKKILHGLDGSAGSFKAFQEAVELAKCSGAELHTISVEELPHFPGTIGEIIEEQAAAKERFGGAMARAKEIAERSAVPLRSHILGGHPVKTIAEFVKKNGCDLLVIGFMGHSALYDRVMGSTCQNLVRLAPCSVLVVK